MSRGKEGDSCPNPRVQVEEQLGPAKETLDSLLDQPGQAGTYDFAFVDADKAGYPGYYEQLLKVEVWMCRHRVQYMCCSA